MNEIKAIMDYAPGAATEVIETQDTNTTSISIEAPQMQLVDGFYELRNNSAFDFWKSPEEDLY